MANNRMYLVFMPTKHAAPLGKRMGWGWYCPTNNVQERIEKLYKIAEESGQIEQDDFKVLMEDQHWHIVKDLIFVTVDEKPIAVQQPTFFKKLLNWIQK